MSCFTWDGTIEEVPGPINPHGTVIFHPEIRSLEKITLRYRGGLGEIVLLNIKRTRRNRTKNSEGD